MAKTSWQVKDRYNREHYVRFSLQIRREIGETFKALCDEEGLSYNKVLLGFMECCIDNPAFLISVYPDKIE